MNAKRSATVLSVGDELVIGQTVDTNSAWISSSLRDLGVRVLRHETVDDDESRIADAIRRGVDTGDLIVITGGLGPTADDLTRQALAGVLGAPLVVDELALATLEKRYADADREMPAANRVQALRPDPATMLDNPHGTAPGLHARIAYDGIPAGSADVFCLPGPPREMKPMFDAFVRPAAGPGAGVATRVLRTFGMGESDMAEKLADLMRRDRVPLVGTTASGGVVSVRIRCEGVADADTLLDADEREVRSRLGDYVFATGDSTLPEAVAAELAARGQTVTAAESCTGGLVTAMLTDVPGVSRIFRGGVVVYSNERKAADLGVEPGVFESDGAVSAACVRAMARGVCERFGADYALAVSGVAGPTGGTPEKPVGTVWIACGTPDGVDARRFHFPGERVDIRQRAATAALGLLRLRVIGETGLDLLWQRERGARTEA
ncbi:MAG: competence/damage-inducible protein A [Planctomycetota bacterium]